MPESKVQNEKVTRETAATKKTGLPRVKVAVKPKPVTKTSLVDAVGKKPIRPRKAIGTVKLAAPADKPKKERKPKLIRDSFKFPELEYKAFEALKSRCLAKGYAAKKSELVRAGLIALASMGDEELLKSVESVEKLKTGRPAS